MPRLTACRDSWSTAMATCFRPRPTRLGMYQRAEAFLPASPRLGHEVHGGAAQPAVPQPGGYEPPGFASDDLPQEVTIREFGTRFRVRFVGGHKTGFFCDQRENRKRLAEFCEGRTVLDLCCYTGGFAVQAKCLGKAAEVTGVDLDEEPLKLARENANLNQPASVSCRPTPSIHAGDAPAGPAVRHRRARSAEAHSRPCGTGRGYPQALRLEPAGDAFGAARRSAVELYLLGIALEGSGFPATALFGFFPIKPGLRLIFEVPGAKVTAACRPDSCSFLARTGAAADHPVSATVPETEYLKAVWMRVG